MLSALVIFAIAVGVILGAVCVVIALSAFVYFPEQTPPGEVKPRKAKRVHPGMTKTEVLTILGNPKCKRDAKGRHEEWEYEITGAATLEPANRLILVFNDADGRTTKVSYAS